MSTSHRSTERFAAGHSAAVQAPLPQGESHLLLNNLRKHFGGQEVLKGISLAIPAGQFVAIVGHSGCGKSTLLRLLAGLEHSSAGSVRAYGEPLATQQQQSRLMFQDDRLLPWKTVLENVGLGLQGDWQEQARAVLTEVGLAHRANAWPSQLSGGQRQRVALARALIHRPRLLLLDEPLGALDALTRLDMQKLIERLWLQHQFTVVLVTHDVAEAVQLADRVIVLEQGRVGLDLPILLGRPREASSTAAATLEQRILQQILAQQAPEPVIRPSYSGVRWAL